METKTCIKCNKSKDVSEFYIGQGSTCKQCVKGKTTAWRKANPVRYRATRHSWEKDNIDLARKRKRTRIKRRYQMSPDEFAEWLTKQDHRCAICAVEFYNPLIEEEKDGTTKPVVDHDHRDGHVRGLLCSACNVAIGLLEDDLEIIKAAFHYLKKDLSTGG